MAEPFFCETQTDLTFHRNPATFDRINSPQPGNNRVVTGPKTESQSGAGLTAGIPHRGEIQKRPQAGAHRKSSFPRFEDVGTKGSRHEA